MMGSELMPSRGPGGRLERRENAILGQHLAGLERNTVFGMASIEAQAQLEATKVQAVGHIGQQGLQAVAMVSQMELQLCQALPHAAGRFQAITNFTTMGVAQIISDATYRISK